jgi:hypothetical protein
MNRPVPTTLARAIAGLMTLALALPAALAAQESAPTHSTGAPPYSTRYRVHYLDMHAAEQLAWDQCAGKPCRVSWQSGDLDLSADAATHEKMARALTRADRPHTQSFQLTLLAADKGTAGTAPELPKAAQKALSDLKDFLPYGSYRLLDIAWLRTTASAEAHLVGDQGTPYSAQLHFTRIGDPAAGEILVENFVIRAAVLEGSRPAGAAGKSAPEGQTRSWEDLIKTTFGLHVGETVVVGTSKLGGDASALVVLLTAVP